MKRIFNLLLECIVFQVLYLSGIHSALAADRYWVAATASNWNNTSNWSTTSGGGGGSSVPGSGDVVYFDGLRLGNCIINASVNVSNFIVQSGYTGTISQGTNTITSEGGTFSGGRFQGGSANITIGQIFTISGADFTSTTGTMEIKNGFTLSSGSFDHNNGTVKFTTNNQTISGSPSFGNVEFVTSGIAAFFPSFSTFVAIVLAESSLISFFLMRSQDVALLSVFSC